MALQVVTFRTRALTALVFVAVMLTGLLWNQWSFFILFTIIHFGCWYEFQKLISRIDPGYKKITRFHKYGIMLAGFCVMMFCMNNQYTIGNISVREIGIYGGIFFLFILPAAEILFVRKPDIRNMGYSVLGLVYISLSLGLLVNLRSYYPGPALENINKMIVLIIIASLWINDTMAYLIGSLIGRTPFSKISPKKTWEGTIGGVLFAVVAMGAIGYCWIRFYLNNDPEWSTVIQWMLIALIASVMGTIGDLLQSKLKRLANVKDSGQILPGHGGFLDRFDSLLFATPWIWLYIAMFA